MKKRSDNLHKWYHVFKFIAIICCAFIFLKIDNHIIKASDIYEIDAKCNIGQNIKQEQKDSIEKYVSFNVTTKQRVNISIETNISYNYGDEQDYINHNVVYSLYNLSDVTDYGYYLGHNYFKEEFSFTKDKRINFKKSIVLEPGTYVLSFENYTYLCELEHNISLSNGTIFIQDFQLPDTITMYYDKYAKINPVNITPTNYDISGIKYTSSNENVVFFYDDNKMYANGSGKAIVTATAKNGIKRYCTVIVKNGTPKISNKKMTIYQGYTDQVYVKNTDSKVTWKSSNKKVATVSKGGYIKGKKIGKATITGKVDGKTVKCKVTVKREPINFRVDLYGYDTRSNTFNLTIKNRTKHKLRIYSSGAYSLDKDYKSYDRKLRLTKNRKYIDIKAKKSKDIDFKVKGSRTWWDVKDAEVYFYVKFSGKKFKVCGDYEDGGYYYGGGKWKETSKNEDDY